MKMRRGLWGGVGEYGPVLAKFDFAARLRVGVADGFE